MASQEILITVIELESYVKSQRNSLTSCTHSSSYTNKDNYIYKVVSKMSKLAMKSYVLAFPIFDVVVRKVGVNPRSSSFTQSWLYWNT